MRSPALAGVRDDAMLLSEPERAALAYDLVLSLDGPADTDAATAWEAELERRVKEVESGTAHLIDREQFERRMQDRLNRR